MRAPRHLLVRLPNPLGDAVLATPALRGLRRALPEARITWAGGRAALQALDGLADRDAILPVAGPFARGALAPLRAGRMWRRAAPDAVLLLPHSWSSGIAAVASGASRRVGSGLRRRGWLLSETVPLPTAKGGLVPRSMVRMYLDLASPFGATDDGKGPRVESTPYDRRRAARRRAAAPAATSVFAVNPGAAFGPSKVYPTEKLAAAARVVRDRTGALPLVLSAPGEEALAAEVAQHLGEPVWSTHDAPPDVGELKALLEGVAVLITTDAGPRHLAEALGVATVVLMGPTDPRWTEPSAAVVLRQEDLSCLGCHLRVCPIGHPCMQRLDPQRVAEAACEAAARAGRQAPPAPEGG